MRSGLSVPPDLLAGKACLRLHSEDPLPGPKLRILPCPRLQLTVAHPVHCHSVTRCEGCQVASPCRLLYPLLCCRLVIRHKQSLVDSP